MTLNHPSPRRLKGDGCRLQTGSVRFDDGPVPTQSRRAKVLSAARGARSKYAFKWRRGMPSKKTSILRPLKSIVKRIPLVSKLHHSGLAAWRYHQSNAPLRPCHLHSLFVRSNGEVFPCCWAQSPEHRIGLVDDPELYSKLLSWSAPVCSCEGFRLRSASQSDTPSYDCLNLELSLACNGTCAMCCVNAPAHRGSYGLYGSLDRIVTQTRPKSLVVQGGEVLVQRASLKWLNDIRKSSPETTISVVTNGNPGSTPLPAIVEIFDAVAVSFVGFQPETYKTVMGLSLERAISFSEHMISEGKRVTLKFLSTPINLHEVSAFVRWAARSAPTQIHLADAATAFYVNFETSDRYWDKIFARSIAELQLAFSEEKGIILDNGTVVRFEPGGVFVESGVKDYCKRIGVPVWEYG
jgi:pyruvate-formate lyase-activating enzyme